MVAMSEGNVWVTSCFIAMGYLLLLVIHGSLLGSVICSNSGTEMSQGINIIIIVTCILENLSGFLVENIRFKYLIMNF